MKKWINIINKLFFQASRFINKLFFQASSLLKNTYIQFLMVGLGFALLPTLAEYGIVENSLVTVIGGMLIFTIVALGLNLLLGYSGLISLGTAGFMGLGAYIAAYGAMDLKLPFIASVALAVIIPVILGVIVGFISLRIEGIYLAIATLAVSEIFRKTFEELEHFTNGFSGKSVSLPKLMINNISEKLGFGTLIQVDKITAYYLIVIFLVLSMVLMYNLVNGQLGRAMHAMRGSESAAQAMGINLLKYRLISFALATGYAALGGALYAYFIRFVYPSSWSISLSLNILALVVIGGLRSIYGTLIGAFLVYAAKDLFIHKIPVIGELDGVPYILNGVLIVLVVMFYPNGLIGLGADIKKLFIRIIRLIGKFSTKFRRKSKYNVSMEKVGVVNE